MDEIWRDVVGYEGVYQVSNFGNVRSLDKNRAYKNTTRHIKGKILKSCNCLGYKILTLSKDNIKTNYRVHRIVAEHFINNPDNKPYVNHIDGNKKNNHFSNLEWCTRSENSLHAYKIGLQNPTKYWLGKCGANHHASIKVKCVEDNLLFDSINEASIYYNTQRCSISLVCKGKLKTTAKKHFIYQ